MTSPTPAPVASLAAHQLDAFQAVAEMGGFSKAAKRLGVTQPALSQRIQALEGDLKRRLFVRSPTGVVLTDAGARLLRYCEAKRALESEVLDDLSVGRPGAAEIAGTVRVAGFSSIVRSCLLPAFAPIVRSTQLVVDVLVREMTALTAIITQGSAEIVLLDHVLSRPDVEHRVLGQEQLVLVESTLEDARSDVYLDHDADDETTLRFLAKNGHKTRWLRRSFFDDIYGVIDAAALGLGRAVVPRHLLKTHPAAKDLRVVTKMRGMKSPVVMHWPRQPSYTRAHEAVRGLVEKHLPPMLA